MQNDQIAEYLLNRPIPEPLPPDAGWVTPCFDGYSIANLPATIAHLLGCDLPGALGALPRPIWEGWLPGLRRVVLVILDGLGYGMLTRMQAAGYAACFSAVAAAGKLLPLTSVFPSTTAAALVSLFTGHPPASHGWLAYELLLRNLGIVGNALLLTPVWSREQDLLLGWGLKPEGLVPAPTLAQRLAQEGIGSRSVLATHFQSSGFSRMLYRGMAEVRGHRHASDFWLHLRHMLAETRGSRSFLTAYWGGLDTVGHAYGPDTDLWQAEFRTVEHLLAQEFLRRIPAVDREGTLLLITADHGQISVPESHVLTADEVPELRRCLLLPLSGESRAAFLHPVAGQIDVLRAFLAREYASQLAVFDSEALLQAGLLGRPVSEETRARAGELIVLARSDGALQRSRPRTPLLGRHGGLTAEEMMVPLLGVRLESLP